MPAFDQQSRLKVASALIETTVSSITATNSAGVDTKGYEACSFAVVLRAIAASQVASIKIQQSDDNGVADAWADVPADELLGSLAIADDDDNTTKLVGTVGKKRYQRAVVTTTTTGATVFSIASILGQPKNAPTA